VNKPFDNSDSRKLYRQLGQVAIAILIVACSPKQTADEASKYNTLLATTIAPYKSELRGLHKNLKETLQRESSKETFYIQPADSILLYTQFEKTDSLATITIEKLKGLNDFDKYQFRGETINFIERLRESTRQKVTDILALTFNQTDSVDLESIQMRVNEYKTDLRNINYDIYSAQVKFLAEFGLKPEKEFNDNVD
jgi:hypothetical protein